MIFITSATPLILPLSQYCVTQNKSLFPPLLRIGTWQPVLELGGGSFARSPKKDTWKKYIAMQSPPTLTSGTPKCLSQTSRDSSHVRLLPPRHLSPSATGGCQVSASPC